MKIKITHNAFIVYPTSQTIKIVKDFTSEFDLYEDVKCKSGIKKVLTRRFFTGNKFKNEFIFNIEALRFLIFNLKKANVSKEEIEFIIDKPSFNKNLNVTPKGNLKLRDYQLEYMLRVIKEGHPYRLMSLGTGKGKALYDLTKVKTDKGVKFIKDLTLDDFIISNNYKKSKVIGIYP